MKRYILQDRTAKYPTPGHKYGNLVINYGVDMAGMVINKYYS